MCEQYKKIALPAMLVGVALTALTLIFPQVGFLEWITLIPFFLGAFVYCADPKRSLLKTYFGGFLTIFAPRCSALATLARLKPEMCFSFRTCRHEKQIKFYSPRSGELCEAFFKRKSPLRFMRSGDFFVEFTWP